MSDEEIKKVGNNNTVPIIDELVYYFKLICRDIVIKNETQAMNNETVESTKKGDLYIQCKDGTATLKHFKYTREELLSYGVPENLVDKCINIDINYIPENLEDYILRCKVKEYIDNYEELNNYYRCLNGLPDLNAEDIYIDETYIDQTYIDLSTNPIDFSKPIHEMSVDEQDALIILGVRDRLLSEYPNAKFLHHIGSQKIPIYKARSANRFQLLYIPKIPVQIQERFEDKYEKCRKYTMMRIYSNAFKYGSDYYESCFISTFIVVQTMTDIFSNMSDFFISGDIWDLGTIKLLFEANGIDYFPEIPKKYQIAMVKNMNRLKKNKGNYQSIVDISSLFGFDNIEIFKYYLLKVRNRDGSGNFTFANTGKESDDYHLKFLKVPLNDSYDDHIHDPEAYKDYDEVTFQDEYWDGGQDHETVKQAILDYEFNVLRSKYLSIDSVYSLSELAFQTTYFYTMIYDDYIVEDQIMVSIPTISTLKPFKLIDIFSYLFAVSYIYLGYNDRILYDQTDVLSISGFNFEANIDALAQYALEQGFTLEELGVSDFTIPKSSVLTFNQLLTIFTNNKKVYDHLVKQLVSASNKQIYDIYKHLYDSLMVTTANGKFFKKPDGTHCETYAEYIKLHDTVLYEYYEEIVNVKDEDERMEKITNSINDIITILEAYMDQDKYSYLWNYFPTVSAESVKRYMYQVINFYKSFKVDILNVNTVYKFDDQLENTICQIDKMRIKYGLHKRDIIEMIEKISSRVKTTMRDNYYENAKDYDEEKITIIYHIHKLLSQFDYNDEIEKTKSHGKTKFIQYQSVVSRLFGRGKTTMRDCNETSEVLIINGNRYEY